MEVYEEVVDTHLADEFQKEFRRFALAAAEHPEHFVEHADGFRRANLMRFP